MDTLYSSIPPLNLPDNATELRNCLLEQFKGADSIVIAVGYVSRASLEELDHLIETHKISKMILILGMYYINGMPESIFHTAINLNDKLVNKGLGEVRIVRPLKYHGKIYCFYKNDIPNVAIIGSANLSILKPDHSNIRQYETAILINDTNELEKISSHLKSLEQDTCSINIARDTIPIIREENNSLNNIENVIRLPPATIDTYMKNCDEPSFFLDLKVPSCSERLSDSGCFTKSNINVCYAAPRNKRKSRDWFEMQLTVSKETTQLPGYPVRNVPFYIITDDGYKFLAHTTSDGNKQFSAVGDELIMGRWLKGRLVAAGLVKPVNDTQADTNREGMITKEMLAKYGCNALKFTKTSLKEPAPDGQFYDTWFLSFERN